MATFKLGIDNTTSKVVMIAEAKRGLDCDCICPDCKKDFVAVKGNKNDWHFRHYEETNCKGGQETALHLLAKEIIANNNQINLPFYGTVFYENAVTEKYFNTIKPDVTANTSGQNLFFEVLVTHRVDAIKEKYYRVGEHKSVEIDLQNYKFTTRIDLEIEILTNCNIKRIIYWEKKIVVKKRKDNSWIVWLIIVVLTFSGLKFLFDRRR